jgi:hypothetical protein
MDRKSAIHSLLGVIAFEVLSFIKEAEAAFEDRWVPATYIKDTLNLNFVAVPKDNKQYGEKGWFFVIIARMLEDDKLVEYKKDGNRAFYRTYSLNKI